MACIVDGCEKDAIAKGYCNRHYTRFWKYGNAKFIKRKYWGLSKTKLYQIWIGMLQRCGNPKTSNYHRYGGRGIEVCAEWKDFLKFKRDMGERPSKEYQIDRIDNDGNYTPNNCRWVLREVNMRNSTACKLDIIKVKKIRKLLSKGITQKKIAEIFSVHHNTINRISRGITWKNI